LALGEERELGGLRECGVGASEDLIGAIGEAVEEEGFSFTDLGSDAEQDRGVEGKAFDIQEVLGKQAVCFARVELVVLQGGEQVQEDVGMHGGGGAFEQVQGLVGGEGAAEEEAFCSFF